MVFAGQNGLSLNNKLKFAWKSYPWASVDDFYYILFSYVSLRSSSSLLAEAQDQKVKILTKYLKNEEIWPPDLIEIFSSSFENNALGQFFTPREICLLVGKLVQVYFSKQEIKVYDPSCGVGSLLLGCGINNSQIKVYGQELNAKNCSLARKILKKYSPVIKSGNTLINDRFKKKFQVVVCNPPFNQVFKEKYYGSNLGNIIWTRHCLKHLKNKGIALIILNNICLFGSNTYELRKELIDNNLLEGIILFKNSAERKIFQNTFVNFCLFILKERRKKKKDLIQLLDLSLISESRTESEKEIILQSLVFKFWKEKKGILVSNQQIKENDYSFLPSIYSNLEENEKSLKENFELFLIQGNLKKLEKYDLALIIPCKFFNLEQLRKDIYLVEKEGLEIVNYSKFYFIISRNNSETESIALYYYLINNLLTFSNFYQGSIIREFIPKVFLNWKINWGKYLKSASREWTVNYEK